MGDFAVRRTIETKVTIEPGELRKLILTALGRTEGNIDFDCGCDILREVTVTWTETENG